jgi:hypothetical protein
MITKSEIEAVKKHYDYACKNYIYLFALKHKLSFLGWFMNQPNGIARFNKELAFSMETIIFDINNRIPKKWIFDWVEEMELNHELGRQRFTYEFYCIQRKRNKK